MVGHRIAIAQQLGASLGNVLLHAHWNMQLTGVGAAVGARVGAGVGSAVGACQQNYICCQFGFALAVKYK